MVCLSQLLIIVSFTLAGEALQWLLPFPIPASVYGLLLLFAALCSGLVKLEQVKQTGNFLASLLPVLFVGPTVAIAEQWDLIAAQLFPIALLLPSSTILTFFISGHITQWLLRKGGGCRE